MNYPPPNLVESADQFQLASWYRHLPSPGSQEIGKPGFHDACVREAAILSRIAARLHELGGITPTISKAISP